MFCLTPWLQGKNLNIYIWERKKNTSTNSKRKVYELYTRLFGKALRPKGKGQLNFKSLLHLIWVFRWSGKETIILHCSSRLILKSHFNMWPFYQNPMWFHCSHQVFGFFLPSKSSLPPSPLPSCTVYMDRLWVPSFFPIFSSDFCAFSYHICFVDFIMCAIKN